MAFCGRCKKRERILSSEFCGLCLKNIIEKRAEGLAGTIYCKNIEGLAGSVARHIAQARGEDITLTEKFYRKSCLSADDLAAEFIAGISGKMKDKQTESFFAQVTDAELEFYAKAKSIKYEKIKQPRIKELLRKLQEAHPGSIEAFARGAQKFRENAK